MKGDEISLSLCHLLGVTTSHDLGYGAQNSSQILFYPSVAYGGLGETSERRPHFATHRNNRRRTRVRNWYIWKRIKRASRRRQNNKKGRQGSVLVEREECCPEDHKQRNNLSLLPLLFLLAWSQIGSLLSLGLLPAVCFE